jgi:ribonuclease HI
LGVVFFLYIQSCIHLGITTTYQAELCGAIRAIEIAHQMHWHNLWLETDSASVVLDVSNLYIHVTWFLRNRWKNAMVLLNQMNCFVTHISRKGNQVADSHANFGLTLSNIAY